MSSNFTWHWLSWPQTATLLKAFAEQPGSLRFVGGAVRDSLVGRKMADVDCATTLPPQNVAALLAKAGIRCIPTGIAHGTVTAIIGEHSFEITTLRRDIETDGRHATVIFTDNWQEDAARRDFTMNALYVDANGTLYDYFGGQEDARAGRVRFIGEASTRIAEDYLRILRFFRFLAHFGKSQADAAALAACEAQKEKLATLSGERIHQEWFKLMTAPNPSASVAHMQEIGILPFVTGQQEADLPRLTTLEALEAARGMAPDPLLRTAALLKSPYPFTHCKERLKCSKAQLHLLEAMLHHAGALAPTTSTAQQKQLIRRLGAELAQKSILLAWAGADEKTAQSYRAMYTLVGSWEVPTFPVSGADLLALGIEQGPAMGQALERLEAQWEASNYTLTRELLLQAAKS